MLFEKIKLEPDEKVLKIVRKHWFVLVEKIFGVVLVTLFPFVSYIVLRSWVGFELPSVAEVPQLPAFIMFISAAWFLINIMTVAYIWTDYYLDLWTITDRRIIAVDQRKFFSRHIGSFRLERLQDLSVEVVGILPTFLNYGTIEAQTAGHNDDAFRARGLPDPRGLKALVLEQADTRLRTFTNGPPVID